MQGRTMGRADRHGQGHPGGNLWVKDPTTGIWTAGGASPSRIPNPMDKGQLDRTPWRRGMYGECTHTPRPQVVSVSVEWWLRTSETLLGLTTSGNQNPLLRWQPLQPG